MKYALMEKISPLKPNDIHIHVLWTPQGFLSQSLHHFLSWLPSGEQDQYHQFELDEKRQEFLWSRLFLRRLTSIYLKNEAENFEFCYGKMGKPFIQNSKLKFNLSHTEGLIACSFSWSMVGIDVERVMDLRLESRILLAGRYFSQGEQDYLKSQPKDAQMIAFFKIFTMKESYVKALGYGLSVPLNSFTVPLPALGWSCFGSWEFFNKILRKGYCLAHVAENSKSLSHEYKIHNWNEGFFLNAVNG